MKMAEKKKVNGKLKAESTDVPAAVAALKTAAGELRCQTVGYPLTLEAMRLARLYRSHT
jgi:hypothetical protein